MALSILSPADQVAAHLRQELLGGTWQKQMPGTPRLSHELEVDPKTVLAALNILENEGWLAPAEPGRRRRILRSHRDHSGRPIRIAIMCHDPLDLTHNFILGFQPSLKEVGYTPFLAEKSLMELKMEAPRVARFVKRSEADAWIVVAASRDVLEWFIDQEIPAFALFGRRRSLPIAGAGPDKVDAYRAVVRRLTALEHRSIVLITGRSRREPKPGVPEQAFLDEIAAHGLRVSSYNLPDWEESPRGLGNLLDMLYRITPPTGILVDEAVLFQAVKHHLSNRGIESPADVSLICTDPDPSFEWCLPSIAHIHWDPHPLTRYVLRWAKNVARGRVDQRQNYITAKFIEGGTVGPPP
jgi:DNA-binding LacI/PurR family transcriptional regulator